MLCICALYLHLASYHPLGQDITLVYPDGRYYGTQKVNPYNLGAELRANGLAMGAYYNSVRNLSTYVSYGADWQVKEVLLGMDVGVVTGYYSSYKYLPALTLRVEYKGVRLTLLPDPELPAIGLSIRIF